MGDIVKEWAPCVVGLLLAAGGFGWLRSKLLELRLVKKLHAEKLVEVLAERLVVWAEKYSGRLGKVSGRSKMEMVKGRMHERLGRTGVAASDAELEEAIEAAHTRMTEAADFRAAAAAGSASGSGRT